MTVRSWAIYATDTGRIRACYTGPEGTLEQQLRPGEAAIEGEFDSATQAVNPKTGEVEESRPPAPGPGYIWEDRRWIPDPVAAAEAARKAEALARIEELEAAQARPLREYVLGLPGSKERLTAINSEIAELRADLVEMAVAAGDPAILDDAI